VSSLRARLELLCEVNRRLATFTSLDEILGYATARTRELFEAEGCALLLLDPARREFRFPVASQSAASHVSATQLREVRFPATQGIAGWVLTNDRAVAIDDVQHDARFYPGVDAATGTTTRSLYCAPLRTGGGNIGVLEVVNPRVHTDGDLAFLEALASDVAVAHEKAAFSAALRDEASGLRRLARLGGATLVVLGLGLAGATWMARAARALPAAEVVTAPGLLLGAAVAVVGMAIAFAVRRVPSVA
jgi:GAF domain-containing protein